MPHTIFMENKAKAVTFLATLLDNRFELFGVKFGLSSIIDLVPGFGDMVDIILACFIIILAIQMRLPRIRIIQMICNVVLSFFIGLLPIIGDAAYIFYKPNLRNLHIIQKYYDANGNIIAGEVMTEKKVIKR